MNFIPKVLNFVLSPCFPTFSHDYPLRIPIFISASLPLKQIYFSCPQYRSMVQYYSRKYPSWNLRYFFYTIKNRKTSATLWFAPYWIGKNHTYDLHDNFSSNASVAVVLKRGLREKSYPCIECIIYH